MARRWTSKSKVGVIAALPVLLGNLGCGEGPVGPGNQDKVPAFTLSAQAAGDQIQATLDLTRPGPHPETAIDGPAPYDALDMQGTNDLSSSAPIVYMRSAQDVAVTGTAKNNIGNAPLQTANVHIPADAEPTLTIETPIEFIMGQPTQVTGFIEDDVAAQGNIDFILTNADEAQYQIASNGSSSTPFSITVTPTSADEPVRIAADITDRVGTVNRWAEFPVIDATPMARFYATVKNAHSGATVADRELIEADYELLQNGDVIASGTATGGIIDELVADHTPVEVRTSSFGMIDNWASIVAQNNFGEQRAENGTIAAQGGAEYYELLEIDGDTQASILMYKRISLPPVLDENGQNILPYSDTEQLAKFYFSYSIAGDRRIGWNIPDGKLTVFTNEADFGPDDHVARDQGIAILQQCFDRVENGQLDGIREVRRETVPITLPEAQAAPTIYLVRDPNGITGSSMVPVPGQPTNFSETLTKVGFGETHFRSTLLQRGALSDFVAPAIGAIGNLGDEQFLIEVVVNGVQYSGSKDLEYACDFLNTREGRRF